MLLLPLPPSSSPLDKRFSPLSKIFLPPRGFWIIPPLWTWYQKTPDRAKMQKTLSRVFCRFWDCGSWEADAWR